MTERIIKILRVAALFPALLAAATGCDKEPASSDAYFAVYIEDSPADFKSLTVNIDKIELYNSVEWQDLAINQSSVPLLELTGGTSLQVADGYIVPGLVSKLRLTFKTEENRLVIPRETTDTTIILKLEESDKIIELPIEFAGGGGSRNFIMLDIDAAASVVFTDPDYRLKPAVTFMDLNRSGAISGSIIQNDESIIIERMLVEAVSSDGTVKHTYTNTSYGKFFIRLPEGTYTINIHPSSISSYLGTSKDSIIVRNGQPTALGHIQLRPIQN